MIEQYGRVVRLEGNRAVVAVKRESACGGNCGNCGGCKDSSLVVRVKNEKGAKTGDTVVLSMPAGRLLKAAFLVYLVPIFLMLAAYLICFEATAVLWLSAIVSLVVLAGSFAGLKLWDRRVKVSGRYEAILERIIL